MPAIKGEDAGDGEALGDSHDGCIDKANVAIGVLVDQLSRPRDIGNGHAFKPEPSRDDVSQEGELTADAHTFRDEVICLGQHCHRDK
jgi:hypothetical protein